MSHVSTDYPRYLYKAADVSKKVHSAEEHAAAIAEGWYLSEREAVAALTAVPDVGAPAPTVDASTNDAPKKSKKGKTP